MANLTRTASETTEDYLDEDPVISNQLFACISIFTPNSIKTPEGEVIKQENNVRAFKIRGVYSSSEKAEKRCEEIRKFDRYHNVFVGEVGKWLPWDDDASNAEEAVYAEPKLNDMMKAYKDSQQKATEYNEERKMKAHAEAKKKKQELEKKEKQEVVDEVTNDIITKNIIESEVLTSDQDKLNKLKESLNVEENKLKEEQEKSVEKEETINKIDDELEKARHLYEELMKKYNLEKNNN
jgi:hypothetical protein